MNIYVDALGCKLNQSEMENLGRQFLAAGHQVVSDPRAAHIMVFNTCTVTHIAARKSRQALRKLRRANPTAFVIATGCYVQMSPQDIRNVEGIDLLVDNRDKDQLFELLSSRIPGLLAPHEPLASTPPFVGGTTHTRTFVKIQDGCNNACAYCIVTHARGPAISRDEDEILAEVRDRLAEGYQEIVLTGVHIGSYGQEHDTDLAYLTRRILCETTVPRLRLSSIEPWDCSDALLACWQDKRLCRHLHLPLQSGCDATLRRMARKYTTAEYGALVSRARAAIPDLSVTTDVIVGFPQETEAEFEQTLAFVREQAFARLHVFQYSLRQGTGAAKMSGQISPPIKDARSQRMRELGRILARRFKQGLLGGTYEILWEAAADPDQPGQPPLWSGLTDNYVRAVTASDRNLHNIITSAKLVRLEKNRLWAEIDPA